MLIAVDIDQVLADTLKIYLQYHNTKYFTRFAEEDCHSLNWWEVFGISEEEFMSDYEKFMEEGWNAKIKPVIGSQKGVDALSAKHKLIAITARPTIIAPSTERWMKMYYPGKFQKVYYTRRTLLAAEVESKHDICIKTGADMLIDDSYEYAKKCADNGLKTLLYTWPWNRNYKLPPFIERVHSWKEILQKVNTLEIYIK